MEGLILDSQELSDQLEQSVLWRSKVSQSRTWSRRLKKDCSLQLLYSQTLKSSLGDSLMEKWTSSVGASLVSLLALQEESKEIKTHDTYGHTSQKELNSWEDLPLFSSRTFQESSQVNSKETIGQTERGLQFCCMSLESWKDWVTKQRRAYSQRLKLAHHTKGKECSFLVSEMNSNKVEFISSMNSSILINQTEVRHGQLQEDKDRIGTNHQELRWATPCTMDHLTPKSQETLMRQATTIRKGRKAPSDSRVQVDPVAMEVYKQANWATSMAGIKNHMGAELILSMDLLSQINQINPQHGQFQEDKHNFGLSRLESQWPTPTAGMEMRELGAKIDYFKRRQSLKKQIGLQGTITLDNQKFVGNLNPRWVETLMGLPIGWTMPSFLNPVKVERMSSDCSGMESSPTQQAKLSNSYGKGWHTPTTLDSREHSMRNYYKDRKCGKERKKEGLSRQALETFNEQRFESFILHIQKSCPESKKLSNEFDECILDHNGKQFVYSSKRILKILIKDSKSKIKQGVLDKYDDTSLEDSALIYAIEDFEYKFEAIKGEFDPVYLEDTNFHFKV